MVELFLFSLCSSWNRHKLTQGDGSATALNRSPSQSYGASLVIWDHSVTCHQTQVNAPHLNPSQIGWYSIYVPWMDGRLSWPRRLVTYRDGLPACRQSKYPSTYPARRRVTSLIEWNALPLCHVTNPSVECFHWLCKLNLYAVYVWLLCVVSGWSRSVVWRQHCLTASGTLMMTADCCEESSSMVWVTGMHSRWMTTYGFTIRYWLMLLLKTVEAVAMSDVLWLYIIIYCAAVMLIGWNMGHAVLSFRLCSYLSNDHHIF